MKKILSTSKLSDVSRYAEYWHYPYGNSAMFNSELSTDYLGLLPFISEDQYSRGKGDKLGSTESSNYTLGGQLFTWFTDIDLYKTNKRKIEKTDEDIVNRKLPIFHEQLSITDQKKTAEWFEECYILNPGVAKQMLQKEFSDLLMADNFDEVAIVNLLRLMGNFEFEEMLPVGSIILTSALTLKSDKVKSAVLDIFGHWPNKSTYNILKKLEPPVSFLYRLKFDSLLKSFEKKYAIST